jgi:hypothetical protein
MIIVDQNGVARIVRVRRRRFKGVKRPKRVRGFFSNISQETVSNDYFQERVSRKK